ncbi:MAG: mechanosensitive ion channel family protein [Halodesulfurarchaeum sp.]
MAGKGTVAGFDVTFVIGKTLAVLAIVLLAYGVYAMLVGLLTKTGISRRRAYTIRTGLRLLLFVVVVVGSLSVITEQWVGAFVSLGVAGVALSLALQQPLLNVLGWVYIVVKRPYEPGDRVTVKDATGDVMGVDFLVTKLWETGGPLVGSAQPSGRLVTIPNSAVLSAEVFNYIRSDFPYVWNDLTVKVAYETDLDFAITVMHEETDAVVGEEMAERVHRYRQLIEETPVDLGFHERPTVNVRTAEEWVELRVRYLVAPRESQAVRNDLYRRILTRFSDNPDRVKFPVGRNR